MKIEVLDDKVVITLPIAERPSKTGKTTIIAGTSGFALTDQTFKGKPVSVSANVTVPK